ncbi:MAG: hypothetical protein V1910_00860 [bacterium]|nr:hypothetical protein [Patescibacteria group bacterium]
MVKVPNVVVKPNFVSDDEDLPTSFASGGNPDIECLTECYFNFIKKDGLEIRISDIANFVSNLEIKKTLNEATL